MLRRFLCVTYVEQRTKLSRFRGFMKKAGVDGDRWCGCMQGWYCFRCPSSLLVCRVNPVLYYTVFKEWIDEYNVTYGSFSSVLQQPVSGGSSALPAQPVISEIGDWALVSWVAKETWHSDLHDNRSIAATVYTLSVDVFVAAVYILIVDICALALLCGDTFKRVSLNMSPCSAVNVVAASTSCRETENMHLLCRQKI